jgi:flagellar biosynthesis protein FlhF
MKVRRYFAANMRAALEMVRQEQGSDVLILSNRKVDGGVELLTAAGEIDQAALDALSPRRQGQATSPPGDTTPAPKAQAPDDADRLWTNPDTLRQMQRELDALKGLIEQQLSSFAWQDFRGRHPLRARLLRGLTRLGLAPALGRAMVADIDETHDFTRAWQDVLNTLRVRLLTVADPLAEGGRVALCGPTGVGKTTLATKLAARHALAHGSDQVALLSLDEQRLGAHQQLRTFGRLLGIHVESVRDVAHLADHLAALRDKALIVVDTPGFAPQHAQFRDFVASLRAGAPSVQRYLVASATTDYLSLMRIVTALGDHRLDACCVTKLDEAAALGPAASMLLESHLPLAYVSAGQQVPDDVESISAREFLRRMLAAAQVQPVPVSPPVFEQAFAQ